jgi:FMN phosphatase YigB (HAD superfamily)
MEKWIICDLDGTLCNTEHRDHHAQAKEWDLFNAKCVDDTPNLAVVRALKAIRTFSDHQTKLMALTARNASMLSATQDWMLQHGVYHLFDTIRMRPEHNRHESDADLKPRLLANFFGSMEEAREKVLFILEDRNRVVKAFRDLGFQVWQVKEGAY